MVRGRVRLMWRWVFVGYALLLAVLTHWPRLAIDMPIHRPDLLIHASAYCVWTVLLERSGLLGRVRIGRTWRWGPLAAVGIVAGVYAALDEWTQQFVGRHAAMDDFAADLVGIVAGLVVVVALGLIPRGGRGVAGGETPMPCGGGSAMDTASPGPPDRG